MFKGKVMKKNLSLIICSLLVFYSNTSLTIWGLEWLFGKKSLEESYWDANHTRLEEALQQFKTASDDDSKTQILQRVMTVSSAEYEKEITDLTQSIADLKTNYRKTMSHIVEKFQKESPSSTIIYLPDNKLVAMMKKDDSDEDKAQVMWKLLQKAKDLVQAKAKAAPKGPGDVATIPPVSPVTVHVHPKA